MTDTAKFHDMGGRPNDDPIDQGEHVLMDWSVALTPSAASWATRDTWVWTSFAAPSRP